MELQQRAWQINAQHLQEPWFAPDEIFYGGTIGEAKSKAWQSVKWEGLKNFSGYDLTFISLPLVRRKDLDKYLVDGELKTMAAIENDREIENRRNKLTALVAQNPDAKAYILKAGSYYRPNCCGYTERKAEAGVYSIQEAVQEVLGCSLRDAMRVVVIDNEEHNRMILDKIEAYKSRLIPAIGIEADTQ